MMAEAKKPKRARYESQKRLDKARGRARVYIGDELERWRQLKIERSLKTDVEVAALLLDKEVSAFDARERGVQQDCERRKMAANIRTSGERKSVFEKASTRRSIEAERCKTRVVIGSAFQRWRRLKEQKGFTSDALVATFLLDSYDNVAASTPPPTAVSTLKCLSDRDDDLSVAGIEESDCSSSEEAVAEQVEVSVSSPDTSADVIKAEFNTSQNSIYFQTKPSAEAAAASDTTDTCENVIFDSTSSSNEDQQEASNGKRTANPSGNKENGVGQDDDHNTFTTSLSVGDGRYLVDLGSSSEFIVDEACLLQLFRSCRECNKQQCIIGKQAKGLKVIVNQICFDCESNTNWTNLPDEDEDSL